MVQQTAVESVQVVPDRGWAEVQEQILTERDILIRVKRGDTQAYQRIVQKYMQTAYYIALGLVHNHQDALDLSQDAFIKAFRKIRSFDTDREFFPWFYRILKNLCLDFFKRRSYRKEIPLDDAQILSQEKEDREMKETLWRGIEDLTFEQREMIILRYFRGYSYQEIAEITNKPMGTVMSSLHYAKKRLKQIVGKYLGFEKEERYGT